MPPCVLYQRLCQQLQVCAPALGVWPRRRLALLVTGLLLARHVALPRVAAQLRRVTAAQADSIERRLRRTLAETEFEASRVFEHVARASLRRLPPGQYLLLLDDTQQTTRCTLSTSSPPPTPSDSSTSSSAPSLRVIWVRVGPCAFKKRSRKKPGSRPRNRSGKR